MCPYDIDRVVNADRIIILGPSGSGKSTLARALGSLLNLPVVHLDREFWRPGFQKPNQRTWLLHVCKLSSASQWILEGDYLDTIAPRLSRTDVLIFLDVPRWTYMLNLLGRIIRFLGRPRYDLGDNIRERLNLRHLFRACRYRTLKRPRIVPIINEARAVNKHIIVLCSRAEIIDFVEALTASLQQIESCLRQNGEVND